MSQLVFFTEDVKRILRSMKYEFQLFDKFYYFGAF